MGTYKEKAFDSALDMIKQLITLASGIIALTITFLKDILNVRDSISLNSKMHWTIYSSWIAFLLTIIIGMLAHGAITGTLDKIKENDTVTIYKENIKFLIISQWICFLLGIIFMIWFSIIRL